MVKNAPGRVRVRISYFGEGFIQTMQRPAGEYKSPENSMPPLSPAAVTDNVSFDVSDSVK